MGIRAILLLCGAVLVSLVVANAAAADENGRYTVKDATVAVSSETGQLPRISVLLDTRTGRTWVLNAATGTMTWSALPFSDSKKLVVMPPPVKGGQ